MTGSAEERARRITDIPSDPGKALRRYLGLWPDSPADEYDAAVTALDSLLASLQSAERKRHEEIKLATENGRLAQKHWARAEQAEARLRVAEEELRDARRIIWTLVWNAQDHRLECLPTMHRDAECELHSAPLVDRNGIEICAALSQQPVTPQEQTP